MSVISPNLMPDDVAENLLLNAKKGNRTNSVSVFFDQYRILNENTLATVLITRKRYKNETGIPI